MATPRARGAACRASPWCSTPPAAECRRRNAARAVSVPADVVANQFRRWPAIRDAVRRRAVGSGADTRAGGRRSRGAGASTAVDPRATATGADAHAPTGVSVGLHLSSFDWPGGREQLGCASAFHRRRRGGGGRRPHLDDGSPPPDPAGRRRRGPTCPSRTPRWPGWPRSPTRVRLGVLVSPAFRHHPAVLAKQIATLDVLSAGRAMCGLGVGWFAQEYAAAGIDFPSVDRRYAHLEDTLQALPLLWGKGSPRFDGATVTICGGAVLPAADPGARPDRRRRLGRTAHVAAGGAVRRRLQPVRRARGGGDEGCRARPTLRRGRPRRRRDRRVAPVDGLDRPRSRRGRRGDRTTATEADGRRAIRPRRQRRHGGRSLRAGDAPGRGGGRRR